MVLADPRRAGTRGLRPHLQQRRQPGRAPAATARAASPTGWRARAARDALAVETAAGLIACERLGEWTYRVDMGAPRLGLERDPARPKPVDDERAVSLKLPGLPDYGPASVVNMGNPHAIFLVDDVAAIPLETVGPRFETHPLFPEKANVSFAEVVGARRDQAARLGARRRDRRSPAARPPARRWSPPRASA